MDDDIEDGISARQAGQRMRRAREAAEEKAVENSSCSDDDESDSDDVKSLTELPRDFKLSDREMIVDIICVNLRDDCCVPLRTDGSLREMDVRTPTVWPTFFCCWKECACA